MQIMLKNFSLHLLIFPCWRPPRLPRPLAFSLAFTHPETVEWWIPNFFAVSLNVWSTAYFRTSSLSLLKDSSPSRRCLAITVNFLLPSIEAREAESVKYKWLQPIAIRDKTKEKNLPKASSDCACFKPSLAGSKFSLLDVADPGLHWPPFRLLLEDMTDIVGEGRAEMVAHIFPPLPPEVEDGPAVVERPVTPLADVKGDICCNVRVWQLLPTVLSI